MSEENTEKPADAVPTEEPEAPKWEHKTEFNVNGLTRELITKTIEATNAEIEALRRKLEKLSYGG